ncbi:GAPES1 domain-containing protein, partial [Escherichia coli]|uniref:GAPES1 domain-containing protein n=1 Tax=Escherichia coli TaxID=562 RepID=UPI002E77A603
MALSLATSSKIRKEAAALLPAFDQAVEGNRHQDDYGSGLGMAEEKFHYYLDLNDR